MRLGVPLTCPAARISCRRQGMSVPVSVRPHVSYPLIRLLREFNTQHPVGRFYHVPMRPCGVGRAQSCFFDSRTRCRRAISMPTSRLCMIISASDSCAQVHLSTPPLTCATSVKWEQSPISSGFARTVPSTASANAQSTVAAI